MKAAIVKSLFVVAMFSLGTVNASTEIAPAELKFELEASCVQNKELDSIALQECDLTVSALEQANQPMTDETTVEAVESVASPVPEPNTAALMVLGFGVLSMVAGARLKRI